MNNSAEGIDKLLELSVPSAIEITLTISYDLNETFVYALCQVIQRTVKDNIYVSNVKTLTQMLDHITIELTDVV